MLEAAQSEGGIKGGKGYKPSKMLFFVMLGVIIASLVLFVVVGPLKGGGGNSGTSKTTSTPSTQH